jgi:plasmid stabilization system protein ParE
MIYRVTLSERADADLRRIHNYAAANAPLAAAKWLTRINARIATLARHPARFTVTDEVRGVAYDYRVTYFGQGQSRVRIYYVIDADEVVIIRVLRGQQRRLRRRDLE